MLRAGLLRALLASPPAQLAEAPLLQCIGVDVRRGKVVLALSDGAQWAKALPLPAVAALVASGALADGAMLRLLGHQVADIGGERVLIATAAEVLQTCARVGSPVRLEDPAAACSGGGKRQQEQSPEDAQRAEAAAAPWLAGTAEPSVSARQPPVASLGPATPAQGIAGAPEQPDCPAAPVKRQRTGPPAAAQAVPPASSEDRELPAARRALAFAAPAAQQPEPATPRQRDGITPIAHLNPCRVRWAVKAAVLWRSELRPFGGAAAAGQPGQSPAQAQNLWFRAQLADAAGSELSAVAFRAQALRLHALLPPGAVVRLSRGSLRPSAEAGSIFELVMDGSTVVEPCPGEQLRPQTAYQFRRLGELEQLPVGSHLDVCGVLVSAAPATLVSTKYGQSLRKRGLVLACDSLATVELTLWGPAADGIGAQLAAALEQGQHPVLAAKAVRRAEWFGPTLSSEDGRSRFEVEPPLPRVQQLRQWWGGGGSSLPASAFRELSKGQAPAPPAASAARATLADIKRLKLAEGEAAHFLVRATVTFCDSDCVYAACTNAAPPADPEAAPVTVTTGVTSGVTDSVTSDAMGDIARDASAGVTRDVAPGATAGGRRCGKRLRGDVQGDWFCEACCGRSRPEWRFRLQLAVEDHTAKLSCIAFDEAGRALMGTSAAAVRRLQEAADTGDIAACKEVGIGGSTGIARRQFGRQLLLQLRVAARVWRSLQTQCFVQRSWDVDFTQESRVLLAALKGTAG